MQKATIGRTNFLLWILVGLYAVFVPLIFKEPLPPSVEMIRYVFLPLGFALWHGSVRYGWKAISIFFAISLVVSNIFENLSIHTGFPFGHYHYSDTIGPKLFAVPFGVGLMYFAMGYVAWTLGNVLLGIAHKRSLNVSEMFTLPLVASFIMVAWDVCFDPSNSTVAKEWIWEKGGSYFGVPVSNFLGWFLTVYVFYQLFALYLYRRNKTHSDATSSKQRFSYWLQAIVWYALVAASFPVTYLSAASKLVTTPAATSGMQGISTALQRS